MPFRCYLKEKKHMLSLGNFTKTTWFRNIKCINLVQFNCSFVWFKQHLKQQRRFTDHPLRSNSHLCLLRGKITEQETGLSSVRRCAQEASMNLHKIVCLKEFTINITWISLNLWISGRKLNLPSLFWKIYEILL